MPHPPLVSFHVDLAGGRTVMDSEDNVVWRPHGMDGWILNYTESGSGRIHRGTQEYHTKPGEWLLFKPMAPHDYGRADAQGSWVHLWVYFFPKSTWFDYLVWPELSPGILRLDLQGHPLQARAVSAFEDIITFASGSMHQRSALTLNALESIFLVCDEARPDRGNDRWDERIRAVVEVCHERYAEAWTIAAFADIAGMSPSRFAHLFRQQVGAAPLVYLEQVRLQVAKNLLLSSGRRIADIAEAVGMPDPAWFAQRFKRWSGVTPRQFRDLGGTRHGT